MTQQEARQRIAQAKAEGSTELDLRNSGLEEIPKEILQLEGLKTLNLGHNYKSGNWDTRNQIKIIPEWIAQLRGLQWLILNDNKIAVIPRAIAQLRGLQWLILNNNKIAVIPESLAKLSKLEYLNLSGNPLNIPDEILGTENNPK